MANRISLDLDKTTTGFIQASDSINVSPKQIALTIGPTKKNGGLYFM